MSFDQSDVKLRPVRPQRIANATSGALFAPAIPQAKMHESAAPKAQTPTTIRVGTRSESQPQTRRPGTEAAFISATSVVPSGFELTAAA
jgi:hypothetical protein